MEDINDLLYDDVEAKYLALQNKKKNRRKKKRKKRLLILLVALALAALYFISDFFKGEITGCKRKFLLYETNGSSKGRTDL